MTENTARNAQLARIRAMMARTVANGCTEAEAAQAATTVDRLLAAYEIDLDELTVTEQAIVRLDVKAAYHEVAKTADVIAAFSDCQVWSNGAYLCYLGFAVDTEIAEYLTLVFQRAADREVCEFTQFNPDYSEANEEGQSNMVAGFQRGMCKRLGERLWELRSNMGAGGVTLDAWCSSLARRVSHATT